MVTTLPSHPNLLHLKHQAKQLLRAHRAGNTECCTILRNLWRFASFDDRRILASPIALHEVQYALAMEYGFSSWNAMRIHLKSLPRSPKGSPEVSLVQPRSVWATIDALADAYFHGRKLSRAQRVETAAFLCERQGRRGSYGGMFAPADGEQAKGLRVYTGERTDSWAGAAHIFGHEVWRAILLLDVRTPPIRQALDRANDWFQNTLPDHLKRRQKFPGVFCCPKCTCSVWRHLLARPGEQEIRLMQLGLELLKTYRDGQGSWRVWPAPYTLLALSEMDHPLALDEMRYAAKACEAQLRRRTSPTNVYSLRRREVYERVLGRC